MRPTEPLPLALPALRPQVQDSSDGDAPPCCGYADHTIGHEQALPRVFVRSWRLPTKLADVLAPQVQRRAFLSLIWFPVVGSGDTRPKAGHMIQNAFYNVRLDSKPSHAGGCAAAVGRE